MVIRIVPSGGDRDGPWWDQGASHLADEEARDSEVAAELARTAVDNQLAILVIQYRVDHDLTQTALARQPGITRRLQLSGDLAELVSA